MIKSLQLRNFRSHKNVTLNLLPGVNAIVGNSDSGKTNVVRALRWLTHNRPSGMSMRSHWAKKEPTEVIASLSEGVSVSRYRDNTVNQYRLSTLEEPLEAVRTDVPDPVKQALNMDAINLQLQGDAPFLLSESPPEVARILNNIAGLDGIDTAHTRIAAKIRENQEQARNLASQLSGVDERLTHFDGVDDLKAKSDHLQELEESTVQKQEQLSGLESLLEEQGSITERLQATEGVKDLQISAEALQKQTQTLQANQKQVSALNDLLVNAAGYSERLEKTEGVESLVERADGLSNSIQEASQRVIAMSLLETIGRKAEALAASVGRLSEEAVAKADSVCVTVLKSLSALSDKARQLSALYSIGVSISEIEKRKPDPNEEPGIMDALKELGACGTCGAAPEHWRL